MEESSLLAPSRPKRSKQKKESDGIHGKRYERKIFALTALKCLLDENIKDFWLLFNPAGINKFEDIVLLIEFKNGKKKLFLIQIKHRQKGTDNPVVANKLDDDKHKDMSLKMYEQAFFEIKNNEEFLQMHDIDKETELICVLFNNCKVTKEEDTEDESAKNDNMSFHSHPDCFQFIDTSKNKGILKVVNKMKYKEEEMVSYGKYNQEFLDRFYFFTEQLNEDAIEDEIGNLLGIKNDDIQNLINFFNSWMERDSKGECIELTKFDVKVRLLDILFGDYPLRNLNIVNDSNLINFINKFDMTIVTEESSSITVWSEIFHEIQNYCGDFSLTTSAWEECIPPRLAEEKFQHFITKKHYIKQINIKLVYLNLVIQRKIPFFIATNNRLFESFRTKLSHVLNIYSVIHNVDKDFIKLPNSMKVFRNLEDIEESLYIRHSKPLMISFQRKTDIDLYRLTYNNIKIRREFLVDDYIKLLQEKQIVGETDILPNYYVNRNIRIPVIKKEVLDETKFDFAVFQCPRFIRMYNSFRTMYNFNVTINTTLGGETQCILSATEEFDGSKHTNIIQSILKDRPYFIFKYIDENHFLLLQTNRSIESIRQFMTYKDVMDEELYKINKTCSINIICNNAGMGKSTFLTFINSKLPDDEWAVHINLKKHGDRIKKLKTIEELIAFTYNCQNKNISGHFRGFFEILYNTLKHKVLWLIDGYEEVGHAGLLDLFKRASREGFRIWIVARPLLKSEFENVFETFSMELGEFTKQHQENFIRKYLKHKRKSDGDINKIMEVIRNTRRLLEDSFIGTCQQTMMLTEIFLNYDWKEREWRIHDVYEKFINLKIDNYGVLKNWYFRTVSKLALRVFFKDESLKAIFDLEEFEDDVVIFKDRYPKDFFISEFAEDDVPIFSHRTYAEYLAARKLVDVLKRQMKGDSPFNVKNIFRLLHLKELTELRRFFDNMVTKDLPHLCAIVNKEQANTRMIEDSFSEVDLIGRSVCHLTSSYGHYFDIGISREAANFVRNLDVHSQAVREDGFILLKPIESESVQPQLCGLNNIKQNLLKNEIMTVSTKDSLCSLNCIDYALMSGSLLELDALLSIRNLTTNQTSLLNLPNEETKYYILYHCIRNNFNNILDVLDVNGLNTIKIDPSMGSFLHLAVNSKNPGAVRKLIQYHSVEDWSLDNQGNTALHVACNQKNDTMIECFYNLNWTVPAAFLNRKNLKGQGYLYFLVRRGHTRWIEKIIKIPGVAIDVIDTDGNTPFLLSVIYHKMKAATLLQSRGANVNHANSKKMTALHYAARYGYIKCVKKLLSWKVEVNLSNNWGDTPLMQACNSSHKNVVVTLLVEGKATLNLPDKKNKWTVLHYAVKKNNLEIIELLLKHMAKEDKYLIRKSKETPLVIACKNNFAQAAKLLLDHNIIHGRKKALEISIKKNYTECRDVLLLALFFK